MKRLPVVSKLAAGFTLAALGLAIQPASAQNLLVNGNFEAPAAAANPGFTSDVITGWNGSSSAYIAFGVQLYSVSSTITPPADGGNQLAYLNVGSLYQDTSATLTAGTTYTLTTQIGRRSDDPDAQSSMNLLTSGGTLLATSGFITAPLGTFAPYTITYTANNPALYGQTVRVQFTQGSSFQSDFDNAILTAAPEPSQWVALLVSVAGLGGLRMRARRRQA